MAIAFMLARFAAPVSVDTGFLDRSITMNGETYRYQVYVPAEWTPNLTWPITVYLHETDSKARMAEGTRPPEIADAIRQSEYPDPSAVFRVSFHYNPPPQ